MTAVEEGAWEILALCYKDLPKAANVDSVKAVGPLLSKSVTATQTNALVESILAPFAAHGRRTHGTAMDKTLLLSLRTYWESHLSANAVQLFVMMRFPLWTASGKVTKSALIDRLLAEPEGVFPCPFQTIVDWTESHSTVADTAGGTETAAFTSAVAAAVAVALQAAGKPDPQPSPATNVVQMSVDNLMTLIASAKASGATADSVAATGKAKLLPLQRLLVEVEVSVRSCSFVEPLLLSALHIAKLRDQGALGGAQLDRRVELVSGSGVYLSGAEAPMEDFSQVCDFTKFLQGMNYLFMLYASDPTVAGRLVDMLTWHHLLWSSPMGTQQQKIKYARAFMYKYQLTLANDWTGKFQSDYQLFQEHLHNVGGSTEGTRNPDDSRNSRQRVKPPRSEPSSARETGGNGRKRPDRDGRRQPDRGGRPPTPGSPKRRKLPQDMLCNSRRAPSFKVCTYPGCRYVHECASCQGDHAAVACTQWSDAKAAAWIAQKNY